MRFSPKKDLLTDSAICEAPMDLAFKNKMKKGIGIMEVLVAIAVLGFLYLAVNNLQSGNRETLLRIRGRDGAVEVAQQVIDSLSRVGLTSLQDTVKIEDIPRTWRGQPGLISHDMTVLYDAVIAVSPDSAFTATDSSEYDKVSHVYAKRIDVTVSWPFKSSTQSIQISRIIR